MDHRLSPRLSRRLSLIAVFLLAVALFSGAVWRYGYVQALHQLADRGEADLLLATDRLTGQLQLYQTLAVVTADHPTVETLLTRGEDRGAADMMRRLADKTGALDVAVVSPGGFVLASASGRLPPRIEGSTHLALGLQGALGEGHGPAPGNPDARAYFFSAPVFQPGEGVVGVLLVVVDVERVEAEWRGARPAIWFTDAAGQVFISNRGELLGWRRAGAGLSPVDGPKVSTGRSVVAGHVILRTDWSPYLPARGLYLMRPLPGIGMQAETLLDVDPARRLAGLQAATMAAICLAFGAVLLTVAERRRTLQDANERLEARVIERTAELSAEVAERIAAEEALKRAQAASIAARVASTGRSSTTSPSPSPVAVRRPRRSVAR